MLEHHSFVVFLANKAGDDKPSPLNSAKGLKTVLQWFIWFQNILENRKFSAGKPGTTLANLGQNSEFPVGTELKVGTLKVLLIFSYSEGKVRSDFVPRKIIVNSEFYDCLLQHLRNDIQRKRLETWANGCLLHHDKVLCHTSLLIHSTEEIPPVRIAPVSSQLINAALSFGRNVRDPRIRQMSSRLESQLISTVAQSAPTPPHPSSTTTHPPPPTLPAPENKIDLKLRKDKKSNSHQHKERSSRSEEENKHNRLSSRSSDKSSTKQHEKLDKTSPSKRSERKNEKKLKVEDLFSSPRSKSPLQVKSLHSLSKSHSKRDQTNLTDTVEPSSSTSHLERVSKIESSPKRTKYHDNWQGVQSSDNSSDGCLSKQTQKLSLDVAKAQNIKQSESPKVSVSPEALDNSAEMLDEDIEKIVKHPDIVSKINKVAEVENIDESHESSKSSDDSIDGKFDEIIKNPTKTSKFEKLNKINDEKMTGIAITSGAHNNEKTKQSKEICSTSTLNNPIDSSQRIPYVDQNKIELQRTENLSISGQVKNTDSEEQNLAQSTNDPAVNSTSYVDENIQTSEPSVKEDSKRSEFQFSDLTSEQAEVSSTVNSVPEIQHLMSKEEINSAKAELSESDNLIFTNKDETYHVNSSSFEKTTEETQFIQTSQSPQNDFDHSEGVDTLQKLRNPDQLILSPRKVQSPIRNIEPMEIIEESNEDITSLVEFPLSKKSDKRRESPVHQERKLRKGDKPSIMEQIIADAEKHDASPSPPPPPIISDKFKEIKQSSLSRLRRVGRPREDLADAESPEPADVDLRTQIQPSTLPKGDLRGPSMPIQTISNTLQLSTVLLKNYIWLQIL
ncbi:hypothetical protein J6590_044185 [Homalodisca vitripennis]|nr:hypothetical protein J6590_044185 [Homalodisca vitripennis]